MPFGALAGRRNRQNVRVPDPSTLRYFKVFPALAGVYLEDSWVLDVMPEQNVCASGWRWF